jgi:hypothetical protein
MEILVRAIGVLIAILGLILVLTPKGIKAIFDFFAKGKRIYWVGLLRIAFGIIFLLASSVCRWPEVIRVLGVFFIIAGSLIFILGIRKVKSVLEYWSKKPPLLLRFLSLLAVAFGILIIYAA